MLLGIDVSKWQGKMDWKKAKSAGACFAYIKATERVSVVDTQLGNNHAGAKDAGIPHGFYHFFRGDVSGGLQAKHFLKTVSAFKAELPPVLDVESAGNAEDVKEWLRIVGLEGIQPVIYTNIRGWGLISGNKAWASKYDLWVANWKVSKPNLPAPWKTWVVWQWSADGNLRGPEFGAIGSKSIDLDWAEPEWLSKYTGGVYDDPPVQLTIEQRVSRLEAAVFGSS